MEDERMERPSRGLAANHAEAHDAPSAVFRLVPVAEPSDSRWDLAPAHGVVVVRARSPADARIVAAAAEVDYLDIAIKPAHGTSTVHASAFRDEKLYSAVEDNSGVHDADGPRGVLSWGEAR
jgi:hypothetical protein